MQVLSKKHETLNKFQTRNSKFEKFSISIFGFRILSDRRERV